ncbi:MAG: branched-chain amino acid ABC transporter permease [Parvibaculaceae bacterium]
MLDNLQLLFSFPVLGADLVANGLMIGAIFALAAFGMALVWGVLGIINVAQGEFVMLGGFVALTAAQLGVPVLATIPLAALALFLIGWGLYRLVIFRIVDRDLFVSLLATFGLSIVLQQLSNEVFGADVRTLETGLGSLYLFDGQIVLSEVKLVAFGTALVVGLALWTFLKRARLGQAIRATAQNARAARILGINTDRVYAATYALNAALCGAAGSLVVMAWTIHPYIGLPYTVRSFLVVVVAGIGNIFAVVAAGLGLGALENVAGFILGAEYQIAFVFVLMVVILVVRNALLRRKREYLK